MSNPMDARTHFTQRAARYNVSSHWVSDPEIGKFVWSKLSPRATDSVLDVACGTGQVSAIFKGRVAKVTGADITEAMFEQARPHVDELVMAPGEKLPFADGTFDIATCRQGIQFMDDARAVREMVRVVKPGGKVCLIHLCAYGEEDKAEYFEILRLRNEARKNFYLRGDLARLLVNAGAPEVHLHDWVSVEDVDVWSNTGAIREEDREAIRNVYRTASPAFLELHAAKVGDRIVDHMLFGVAIGVKPR
ncbi:MAG: class I SAM-dependent methyltransferase [Myxococcota bacterium]